MTDVEDGEEPEYPGGWFGPAPFALVCEDSPHRATPVGEPCDDCKAAIKEGDSGLLIPGGYLEDGEIAYRVGAAHITCFRRGLGGKYPRWSLRWTRLARKDRRLGAPNRIYLDIPWGTLIVGARAPLWLPRRGYTGVWSPIVWHPRAWR